MASDNSFRRLTEALLKLPVPDRIGGIEGARGTDSVSPVEGSNSTERTQTKEITSTFQEANLQLLRLVDSLDQTRATQQEQVRILTENTSALLQRPVISGNSGQSVPGRTATTAAESLKSNFLLSPVLRGILGLFGGGGKTEAPPPLPEYSLPPSINLEAGFAGSSEMSTKSVDYGQNGLPRLVQPSAPTPQITVQVQAFDSRSFLDHSEEIAMAVRQAVLSSHALNDVVNEL